jgi:hypothetical protein
MRHPEPPNRELTYPAVANHSVVCVLPLRQVRLETSSLQYSDIPTRNSEYVRFLFSLFLHFLSLRDLLFIFIRSTHQDVFTDRARQDPRLWVYVA